VKNKLVYKEKTERWVGTFELGLSYQFRARYPRTDLNPCTEKTGRLGDFSMWYYDVWDKNKRIRKKK